MIKQQTQEHFGHLPTRVEFGTFLIVLNLERPSPFPFPPPMQQADPLQTPGVLYLDFSAPSTAAGRNAFPLKFV